MGRLFDLYFDLLVKLRYVVVLCWLVVFAVGVFFGPQLLNHTQDQFQAPDGSPAYDARKAFANQFPEQYETDQLVLLVHSLQTNVTVSPSYLAALTTSIDLQLSVPSESSYMYRGILSYAAFPPELALVAQQFMSPLGDYSIVAIQFQSSTVGETNAAFVKLVRDIVFGSALTPLQPSNYSLGLTGLQALFADVNSGTEADLERVDSVVLPLAFFVLAVYLRSVRLMALPLLSLLISILASFSLVYSVTFYIDVAAVAPAVMMSLSIAMCIDYNLFLLTRFREEILRRRTTTAAVYNMLESAGHVVLVSGSTLAFTFAGLAFFPMDFLRAIGVSGSVSIAMTLIINLSLTPCILLIFPKFFSQFSVSDRMRRWCPSCLVEDLPDEEDERQRLEEVAKKEREQPYKSAALLNAGRGNGGVGVGGFSDPLLDPALSSSSLNDDAPSVHPMTPLSSNRAHVHSGGINSSSSSSSLLLQQAEQRQQSSYWFKVAQLATQPRSAIVILVLVLALLIPVSVHMFSMKYTVDNMQLFPRDSTSLQVFHQLQQVFPPGTISVYKLLIANNNMTDNGGVMSDAYFTHVQNVIHLLIQQGYVEPNNVQSIAFANGVDLTVGYSQLLLAFPLPCDPQAFGCSFAAAYQYVFNQTVSPFHRSAYIQILTSFDPLSDDAQTWIANVRKVMNNYADIVNNMNGVGDSPKVLEMYLFGGIVELVDAIDQVFAQFPTLVGVTVGLVFLIVAVVFRSVFVPFRLIFSIGLSITFTYGLAIYVFQDNKFDAFSDQLKSVHALYWLTPVMSFSILVGLGLDYDVFLYSRIVEYRQLGYTNRAAITKGVYRTGSIITGAGLIMAISFGGLMLSQMMVLDSFGFILCFAVLLDTFVVRTLFVPAVLFLAGNVNWWPVRMPTPTKDEHDHCDVTTELLNDEHGIEHARAMSDVAASDELY